MIKHRRRDNRRLSTKRIKPVYRLNYDTVYVFIKVQDFIIARTKQGGRRIEKWYLRHKYKLDLADPAYLCLRVTYYVCVWVSLILQLNF